MSNIYVVGQTGHNNVKVGMTTRSVDKRIADWDTGSPFEWIIHLDIQVEPKAILPHVEAGAHFLLKAHRVRNEWFNATPLQVCKAIADALAANGATKMTVHRSSPKWGWQWDMNLLPDDEVAPDNCCPC